MLPHILVPLMQQKIVSQSEALELAMKLETSPIGETGARIIINSVVVIRYNVENTRYQYRKINSGGSLVYRMQNWRPPYQFMSIFLEFSCIRSNKYHKFTRNAMVLNFLDERSLTKGMLYLQNIVGAPAILYCKFYKYIGHDDKYCWEY